ncbi:MAG: zinc-dependent alcohol dehydrogenase family protein [Planctomycetes bacterium]|nr:zinc-dependent alcohol dehydrogenase family protein [Planctomycetota bacterium]
MQAMVLHRIAPISSSPLTWDERPDPQPAAGQVRLRVRCCAICRTDLHVIEGDLPPRALPLIPGHQAVGEVDAVGAGCTDLAVGDRAGVAWLGRTCGTCPFCRSGRENLCESSRYTGWDADGGYATATVVDEAFAYRIPETFDDVHAAPLLCAGIIGYAALQRCELPAGGTLALYGFGSSAHVVMQIARHRGSRVYVVTRGDSHRRLARQMGAAWAGGRAEDLPVDVDSAILFAPAGELVPPALARLRPGGTLALAGIRMTDIPPLNYEKHLFHARTLRSVTANTRADGEGLLREAAAIPIRPHVACYALRDANRALRDLKADRIDGTGVLTMPEM